MLEVGDLKCSTLEDQEDVFIISYIVNTVAADDLVIQRLKALAAIMLT